MNLKAAVKYQLWESKNSLIIFYGIISAIYALALTSIALSSNTSIRISGFELSSMIFIFVFGLNLFTDTFMMFLQNGISRGTLYKSLLATIVPVAAFMAAIDSINSNLANLVADYQSMFSQLYHLRYSQGGGWQFLEGLLWYLTAYAMVGMIGLFITTLYYRMGKKLKLLVSIGVPVLLVIVLPAVDTNFTNGAIFGAIAKFFAFAWGYQNGFNPYYSMVTCTVIAALFAGLTWLLVRKATIKD